MVTLGTSSPGAIGGGAKVVSEKGWIGVLLPVLSGGFYFLKPQLYHLGAIKSNHFPLLLDSIPLIPPLLDLSVSKRLG